MDAGPLSIMPRERGASEGRGGGAPFLDGKRGLLVAVVARVAREALAEAVVAVAEAAARARWTNSYDVGPGSNLTTGTVPIFWSPGDAMPSNWPWLMGPSVQPVGPPPMPSLRACVAEPSQLMALSTTK